jgi:hypothetical protein
MAKALDKALPRKASWPGQPIAELREEMRAVARGERTASPLPAAPLLCTLNAKPWSFSS